MSKPVGYRCNNCGNMLPISRSGVLKCQFCGSEYKVKEDYSVTPVIVRQQLFDYETLEGRTVIPDWLLRDANNKEKLFETTLSQMARNMSEKLLPLMQLSYNYDPEYMQYNLYGRIRVAIPRVDPNDILQEAFHVDASAVFARKEED